MPTYLPRQIKPYRNYLKKIESYFDMPSGLIKYEIKAPTIHDIASQPYNNKILFGTKWLKLRDRDEAKKRIIHEFVHLSKFHYPHSQEMRNAGYFSHPKRDKLSWRIKADIDRGVKKFDPRRYDLPLLDNPYNRYGDEVSYYNLLLERITNSFEDVDSEFGNINLQDNYYYTIDKSEEDGALTKEEADRLKRIVDHNYASKSDYFFRKNDPMFREDETEDRQKAKELHDLIERMKRGETFDNPVDDSKYKYIMYLLNVLQQRKEAVEFSNSRNEADRLARKYLLKLGYIAPVKKGWWDRAKPNTYTITPKGMSFFTMETTGQHRIPNEEDFDFFPYNDVDNEEWILNELNDQLDKGEIDADEYARELNRLTSGKLYQMDVKNFLNQGKFVDMLGRRGRGFVGKGGLNNPDGQHFLDFRNDIINDFELLKPHQVTEAQELYYNYLNDVETDKDHGRLNREEVDRLNSIIENIYADFEKKTDEIRNRNQWNRGENEEWQDKKKAEELRDIIERMKNGEQFNPDISQDYALLAEISPSYNPKNLHIATIGIMAVIIVKFLSRFIHA